MVIKYLLHFCEDVPQGSALGPLLFLNITISSPLKHFKCNLLHR